MGNAMNNRAYLSRLPKPPGQDPIGARDSVQIGSEYQFTILLNSLSCGSLLLADGPSSILWPHTWSCPAFQRGLWFGWMSDVRFSFDL